eukprot:CAMPEP_0198692620 /NCGR_PEP_ID=MMETSP1468-20131203/231373_1 /TAXON_ID=1461545 /ORGANISM="Mantoniella sp, Strain CCMP1436" /LENGTH=45 /DNA_ID= /DNA_START= /DNA_END= /DNA_ORIENTATION=
MAWSHAATGCPSDHASSRRRHTPTNLGKSTNFRAGPHRQSAASSH